VENTALTNSTLAGIRVLNGGIVDAGDCSGANITGLGTGSGPGRSSAGGNDLTGYGFDDAAPWAIQNLNTSVQSVVRAQKNLYGDTGPQNIETLLFDDTDNAANSAVIFSQATLAVNCPPGVSAQCTNSLPAGANTLASFLALGGMVSSSSATISYTDGTLAPGPFEGTVTRTYTITDACGLTTICAQTITVDDTIPPVITTCATNQAVLANASCVGSVPNMTNEVIATDNCNPVTISQNPPAGAPIGFGPNSVALIATDATGNSSTCMVTVTVVDMIAPIVTCPANVTTNTAPGQCSQVVTFPTATATDNCPGTVTVGCSPPSGSTFPKGPNTVTCTATDASGNSTNCTFIITVNDTQNPTIGACPANIFVFDNDQNGTEVVTFTNPTATDNCPGVSVTCAPPSGSTFALGSHDVTCTAQDTSSNQSSCTFKVFVCGGNQPVTYADDDYIGKPVGTFVNFPDNGLTGPHVIGCDAFATVAGAVGAAANGGTVNVASGNYAENLVLAKRVNLLGARNGVDARGRVVGAPSPAVESIITAAVAGNATLVLTNGSAQSVIDGFVFPSGGGSGLVGVIRSSGGPIDGVQILNNHIAGFTDASIWLDRGGADITIARNVLDGSSMTVVSRIVFLSGSETFSGFQFVGNWVQNGGSRNGFFVDGNRNVNPSVNRAPLFMDNVFANNSIGLNLNSRSLDNGTISMNTFTNNSLDGLQAGPRSSLIVSNLFANNGEYGLSLTSLNITSGGRGAISNTITCNTFTGNGFGASGHSAGYFFSNFQPAGNGPLNHFNYNNLSLNKTGAVYAGSEIIDATNNWWGAASGPTVASNPGGTGDIILGSTINYSPFLAQNSSFPTIACPGNMLVNNDLHQCSAVVTFAPAVSGAFCCSGSLTVGCNPPSGTAFPVGTNTVACGVTNVCGKFATCNFTVTVQDAEPPVILCPADITQNTDPGLCTANVSFAPTRSDNCPGVNFVCAPPSGFNFPKGTNTVNCTATDAAANTASCSFAVVVQDTTPPSVVCPANIVTNTAPGQCSRMVAFAPAPSDNCPGVGVVCVPPSGSIFAKGTNTVNCTATDGSGNTAGCSFAVVVRDLEPPTITCSTNIVTHTDPSQCSAIVNFTTTTADNCPGTTFVCTPPSGATFAKGTNTVNCTATDAAGNTASCSFSVVVNDTENPAVVCPANIVTVTDPDQCNAVVTFAPSASDNCPGVSVLCTPASGSTFAKGTNTVNCTATDASGNAAGCSFTVVVRDTNAPSIICPANILTGTAPGQCNTIVTFTPTTTDNCPGVSVLCTPASGSSFAKGTNTVNCTATDASGNTAGCSFAVVVRDFEPPTITCSTNIAVHTDPGQCSAVVSFSATTGDNCPGVSFVCTPPSGATFAKGTNTVNCTATDASGNTASCSFVVVVNDTENPAIVCPANIVTFTDPGQCNAVVTFAPSPSDNCPGVSVICAPPSGSAFAKGTNTVNCTATDASGNTAGCSFTVAVRDTNAPSITCPANIVTNTAPGQCSQVASFTAAASDNCPGVSVVCAPLSGSTFPKGTNTVNCTATDASGNTGGCSFTVVVRDLEPPTITCSTNIVTHTDLSQCSAVVNFVTTTGDNCPGVSFACTPSSGSTFPKGTSPVNCTATDASGNSTSCNFSVTVNDTENPMLVCPANIVSGTDASQCSAVVTFAPTLTDNCPGAGFVCTPPSGSTFAKGTNTVNCAATDASGNTAGCSFAVIVRDLTPPSLCANAPIIYAVGGTNDNFSNPEAASPSQNQLERLAGLDLKGFDQCSSDTFFAHSFTNLPEHIAEATLRVKMRACADSFPQNDTILLGFTDVGGDLRPEQWSRRIGTYDSPGLTNVNWVGGMEQEFVLNLSALPNTNATTTDLIGALAQRRYLDVYIQDDTGVDYMILEIKTCQCRADIVANVDPNQCGAVVSFATPVFTDACDNAPTVTCSPPSGSFFPVGSTSVTCTATDQSGNQGRCSFAVTVVEPPLALQIERAGTNIIVSWPVTCSTYALEQAANLNPVINWVPASGSLSIVSGRYRVTAPNNGTMLFYRLRKM